MHMVNLTPITNPFFKLRKKTSYWETIWSFGVQTTNYSAIGWVCTGLMLAQNNWWCGMDRADPRYEIYKFRNYVLKWACVNKQLDNLVILMSNGDLLGVFLIHLNTNNNLFYKKSTRWTLIMIPCLVQLLQSIT